MSISADAKALVAAHLTQAWASTVSAEQNVDDIIAKYAEFLQHVTNAKPTASKKSTVDINR